MAKAALDRAAREAEARIIAALAVRYRDLDVAEEAFAEACARAAKTWAGDPPENPSAWLYRVAERCALDVLRTRSVRERLTVEAPEPEPTAEDLLMNDATVIPDERLRLIFVCCHPAVAPDVRAALTLRTVCGLSTREIARAFLISEPALAQRLMRAKRKIAEAGVPFEVPAPNAWAERLDAVLSTIEVAYSKAHEDAAGTGRHAGYGSEMLELTRLLSELMPDEPEVLSFAALVRFAEARRPARVTAAGAMVPLSEQNPALWEAGLIRKAEDYLDRARTVGASGPRFLQASIHASWCRRRSLREPPPWLKIVGLYDALLERQENPIVRLGRAVALAEVEGPSSALAEVEALGGSGLGDFLPYHAVRADLLRRVVRTRDAIQAYDQALGLGPGPAERLWLEGQRKELWEGMAQD